MLGTKMRKLLHIIIVAIIGFLVINSLLSISYFAEYLKVKSGVVESKQPAEIKYNSRDPYELKVVRTGLLHGMFFAPHSYTIQIIGNAADRPQNVVYIHEFSNWVEYEIKASTVNWSPDGVEISIPSLGWDKEKAAPKTRGLKFRLFVSKDNFMVSR